MNIGLVQYSPAWENKKANKEKIISLIRDTEETDLLLFPELSLTGFTMNSHLFCESLKGETFEFFSLLAETNKTNIIAGLIEKDEDQFFNTALIIDKQGSLISRYRKIHPFSYSTENKHYSGGKDPVIVNIDNWDTGISICYDLRFPELYRQYGKKKAALIINIANWPDTRIHHWNTLLRARAIENQCYIAAVNRVGKDPKLLYPGSSVIIDPMGTELLNCADEEKIFTTRISIDQVNAVRSKFPFLDDIRLV